jgi:Family of unknown function (DUF5335)
MHNRLIPRSEWFRFFDGFSHRHEGWPVTMRVVHASLGSQVETRDMPLEGIVSAAEAAGPISIHVGSAPSRHIEHEVAEPRQIWVEISEYGIEEALEIESTDGTKTILQLRSPDPAGGAEAASG